MTVFGTNHEPQEFRMEWGRRFLRSPAFPAVAGVRLCRGVKLHPRCRAALTLTGSWTSVMHWPLQSINVSGSRLQVTQALCQLASLAPLSVNSVSVLYPVK